MARFKKQPAPDSSDPLTRRERQIMDVVFARGRVTAREIHDALADAPTYATVRTILRVLERKGHLSHTTEGKTFVYAPTKPREQEAETALKRLVRTFFNGSVEHAVSGLLRINDRNLDAAELERIEKMLEEAKNK